MPHEHERADGAAGARRAAAVLGIALCAESAHSTLDEDSAKVDLKFTFRHPFSDVKPLVTAHCQVKTGRSYRAKSKRSDRITISGIDNDTIQALSTGTPPALLVWVPPKPLVEIYRYIFKEKGNNCSPLRIRRSDTVTPALRFDLAKRCAKEIDPFRFVRHDVAAIRDDQVMVLARRAYGLLKTRSWLHPVVGPLTISQLGWRHITRRGRSGTRRDKSLKATPYLKAFLNKRPDRFLVDVRPTSTTRRRTTERREVVCWYENALMLDGQVHGLRLRIFEKISYPTGWIRHGLSTKDVEHTATLQSWWCKPGGK